MKKDYQTHVFTSTYTADVSGVCSAMYELGGMSVLHDPSGCNSTYSTHDEPRWFDSDSLMFVSGLDEITAVMGDDSVLIRDVVQAAADLHPRFITLCGASIPHIIAFDYRGVAYLIEKECGVPVLGFLPPMPEAHFESRHLGLMTAAEIGDFCGRTESLAAQLEKNVDLDLLLTLSEERQKTDLRRTAETGMDTGNRQKRQGYDSAKEFADRIDHYFDSLSEG